jgi:hypothetical protein
VYALPKTFFQPFRIMFQTGHIKWSPLSRRRTGVGGLNESQTDRQTDRPAEPQDWPAGGGAEIST